MCRTTIIGNAGGGKSTLCRKIVEAHGLPYFAVDKIQWEPNWKPAPAEKVEREIRSVLEMDRWLIDGWGPWETIEERFRKSDTIIFVDHPVWIHLWWATKRQIRAVIKPRSIDKPEGCDLVPMTWKMYRMIWFIHHNVRPRLCGLVDTFKETKTVYHIRSPKELKRFVLNYC